MFQLFTLDHTLSHLISHYCSCNDKLAIPHHKGVLQCQLSVQLLRVNPLLLHVPPCLNLVHLTPPYPTVWLLLNSLYPTLSHLLIVRCLWSSPITSLVPPWWKCSAGYVVPHLRMKIRCFHPNDFFDLRNDLRSLMSKLITGALCWAFFFWTRMQSVTGQT